MYDRHRMMLAAKTLQGSETGNVRQEMRSATEVRVSRADKGVNGVAGARGGRCGSLKWEQVCWFKDTQEAGATRRVGRSRQVKSLRVTGLLIHPRPSEQTSGSLSEWAAAVGFAQRTAGTWPFLAIIPLVIIYLGSKQEQATALTLTRGDRWQARLVAK